MDEISKLKQEIKVWSGVNRMIVKAAQRRLRELGGSVVEEAPVAVPKKKVSQKKPSLSKRIFGRK